MRVARELGMPLQRLGEEMTAEEFELWQEFITEEPLPPGMTGALAELMHAIFSGLMPKKHGRWTLSDFLPERWRKPQAPVAPAEQFRSKFKR